MQIEEQKLKEQLQLKNYWKMKKLEAQQCSTKESNQLATGTPYRMSNHWKSSETSTSLLAIISTVSQKGRNGK